MKAQAQAQAYAPNQDWTSKGFILENVAKGVLQAIASLSVYALAIWLAIKYSSKFILLGDAVDVKLPMLRNKHGDEATASSASQ